MRIAVCLLATLTGCAGCEGGPGVAMFHPDGTPLDLVASADSGDEPVTLYELHICEPVAVVATLYDGCGGQCWSESTIEALLVDTPALHVLPGGRVDSELDELRDGHLLSIDMGSEVVGRLRVVLTATEAEGGYRAHDDILVIADACP